MAKCFQSYNWISFIDWEWIGKTSDIEWIEEAFPAEVEEFITRDEYNAENEDDYGRDVESSDDEDFDNVF